MADCVSQANERGDVDHIGGDQSDKERTSRHATHRSDLCRIDPQSGNQPGHEHGTPTGVMQEPRCALQNSACVKPASDAEQAVPPQSREELPTNQRTCDEGEESGGNEHQRTELPRSNCDSPTASRRSPAMKNSGAPASSAKRRLRMTTSKTLPPSPKSGSSFIQASATF